MGVALRILHLSQYRSQGGAAKMAFALHEALRALGVDSRFLCQEPAANPGSPDVVSEVSGDPYLEGPGRTLSPGRLDHALQRLDRVPLVAYPRRTREPFSPAIIPGGLLATIRRLAPDVVHLHWIGGGFLSMGEIARLPGPLVWTLHDLWPFTGGCHYPGACQGFEGQCGSCPVLGSPWAWDLSSCGQRRKQAYASRADLHAVGISRWMVKMAERSSLLRDREVTWIPNGVDRAIFSPGDRAAARAALGIEAAARIVLFGAVSPFGERRKGGALLWEALGRLASDPEVDAPALRCLVFGGGAAAPLPEVGPVSIETLGHVADPARLALLYRAADLVVVPSLQEGFGLVTAEALACGAKVVAFRHTGADELIAHRVTGYLAEP
ncbi:MAG: glycosyltransferase, partial [Polyangia bacterium]|nr:glycosyltransferase [Polyangia bacterium]